MNDLVQRLRIRYPRTDISPEPHEAADEIERLLSRLDTITDDRDQTVAGFKILKTAHDALALRLHNALDLARMVRMTHGTADKWSPQALFAEAGKILDADAGVVEGQSPKPCSDPWHGGASKWAQCGIMWRVENSGVCRREAGAGCWIYRC